MINLNIEPLTKFISDKDFDFFNDKLKNAHGKLSSIGDKPDGWIDLPVNYDKEMDAINTKIVT